MSKIQRNLITCRKTIMKTESRRFDRLREDFLRKLIKTKKNEQNKKQIKKIKLVLKKLKGKQCVNNLRPAAKHTKHLLSFLAILSPLQGFKIHRKITKRNSKLRSHAGWTSIQQSCIWNGSRLCFRQLTNTLQLCERKDKFALTRSPHYLR